MIRFKIDTESKDLLDKITNIYKFKRDTVTARIALSLSLQRGRIFGNDVESLPQNSREYTPTSNIFGSYVKNIDNFPIYKAILDQHYSRSLRNDEFVRLYKLHLKEGLDKWYDEINKCDITKGEHISILLNPIQSGLILRSKVIKAGSNFRKYNIKEFEELLTFDLGITEEGDNVRIRLNDLREFDNRNIAIAGMAGSGKTQLVKDLLYQISKNTDYELKFIFFDYKGEGNPDQLKSFLNATKCEFVDVINDGGIKFNPFLSVSLEENQRHFSVRAFVETISTFVPQMGIKQEHTLISVINNLLDAKNGAYPSVTELYEELRFHYEECKMNPDILLSIVNDLSANIFNCDPNNSNILDKSLYLNLPPSLSDTLRQLIVFLLLRYFNAYFSSSNDCEPKNYIFPLRYIIVIDEAHIYLKNKNARKALEELLRLLRSKGVVIMMISQGVEDYKTSDFDFASQVKLPICLNILNKEYRSISSFIGTPTSQYKLESEIKKLGSGKGLINITEPKIVQLRQWWKTAKDENL